MKATIEVNVKNVDEALTIQRGLEDEVMKTTVFMVGTLATLKNRDEMLQVMREVLQILDTKKPKRPKKASHP